MVVCPDGINDLADFSKLCLSSTNLKTELWDVTLIVKIKIRSLLVLTRIEGLFDVFVSPINEFFKKNWCVQFVTIMTK